MEISLGSSKSVIIEEAVAETVSSVELIRFSDDPSEKKVYAVLNIAGMTKHLLLWSGSSYDAIGDWTQEEAENRIVELL